ncbi:MULTISPECIES: RHS repeat-associated core domain-containing protein [unclassified Streptomyces]|uniref:RHS repeat-associated core domain-containing protein n=3 Tax=Streptomyces TaxID=1883 RepID=UPI0038309570
MTHSLTAAMVVAALGASALPALAAPVVPVAPAADPSGPGSVWGGSAPALQVPPVRTGATRPVAPVAEAEPSAEVAAWRAAQQERSSSASASASTGEAAARGGARAAAPSVYVPEGQGAVPWHQVSDFRVTDALVARVNYSNGNLMLAGTDFDVAGVGQNLQLSRTYNSSDAPWGKVSQRWWQGYERYAQIFDAEVVLYGATGDAARFTRNADGTYKTPTGYAKDLKKNADGTYTLTDRKSGSKDTYDANGTLTKVTDRNNGTITVTQHDDGGGEHKGFKVTETRSGRWVDLLKTDASQWQAKDHTGRTAVFDLNSTGDLVRTTDTEGKATQFGYDSSRRLTKITTPEGRVTVFTYDAANRVTSMLRATDFNGSGHTGPTWTYAYSATSPSAAGTTTVTDPEQHATKYEHRADGAVTKVTDALGHSRSKTFDTNLNVDTAADAMGTGGLGGNVTAYGWDARNNPTSAKLPTGATSSLTGYQTIAGADLPGTLTTADDEKTSYTYDTAGNTTSVAVTGTGGGTRTFDHNPATATCGGFQGQRCKATDARSKSTSFTYDAKGNLTKATPPAPQGATTYTYDSAGRPETVTDGRGIKTVYVYDHRDRVVKVSSPNATVSYAYDGDGNLKQRSDGTGVVKYDFDPLSRETVRTLQNGSQTRLTYTPAGNVDTYEDPAGVIDYTWNEVNKLKELKDPTGKVSSYGYNNNDVRTKTTYPGGTVQTVTVDNSGRPKTIKATSAKGTLTDFTYSYANGAKDTAKIRTRADGTLGRTQTYTYDSAGRMTLAKETEGTALKVTWVYCYDAAGNLTSQSDTGTCPGSGSQFSYDDASQLTAKNGNSTGWSYDAAGNETAGASTTTLARTAEKWSDHSQLTSLTAGGTTYTGQYGSTDQSERIKLGNTFFHNGPLGLSATSTGGTDTGFNREPGGTLNSMTTGGKSYYYLTDALGSVAAVADESGTKVNAYYYSPRGVARAATTESVPQPYQFAGGYHDPTGLYHYAARYYDPNIARFTQPDPSGQEKNPYLYAEGDPVNRIDPDGLISFGTVTGMGDWASLVSDTLTGNTESANATKMGMLTGIGVEGLCMTGAAAGSFATLGVSVGAGLTGCSVLAAGAAGATTAVSQN